MLVESLEQRRLFSAPPIGVSASPSSVQATQHVVPRHAAASLLNFSVIGNYQGSYDAITSSGSVEMDVTSQTPKSFSGTLAFTTEDGTVIAAKYRATVGKHLATSFNFKTRNTNLKCTVSISTSDPGFVVLFKGKFDGSAIPRAIGAGEFAVIGL
jgi:hypothetical protein